MAGFVLANGSMSSNQSGDCNARSAFCEWKTNSQGLGSQRDIRRALIEADWEMPSDELRTPNRVSPTSTFVIHPQNFASLPCQLFYSTQIPVCLWFLAKYKAADAKLGKTAFLDNELALAA
jgi:type I restriction enzyme M protein